MDANPPPEPTQEEAASRKHMKWPWRRHFFNWISLVGVVFIILGAVAATLLFTLNVMGIGQMPYLDIVYILFAITIAFGAGLAGLGYLRAWRVSKRGAEHSGFNLFTLDLNRPRHRNMALIVIGVGVTVLVVMSMGTYQATGYMESQAFCTEACHSVMHPQGITYKNTAHAEVKCVDCHVGSGATPMVASKLNGLRQLYGVITGDFARPVPTPVHNMRPARDTCETCHWRDRYIGYKELLQTYYLGDEENTEHKVRMLVNVGGKKRGSNTGTGIHYHMLLGHDIEFIARDARKQDIIWVRQLANGTGGEDLEFNHVEKPITAEERATLKVHKMECLDCHSRPAHQFLTPMKLVNEALETKVISRKLPFIKLEAVRALSESYGTTAEALAGIAAMLTEFYEEEHPEIAEEMGEELKGAIVAVQRIYERSVFPSMKVDWATYPDNIGHKEWGGCFRCHTDQMETKDGETTALECNSCHLILAQGDVDVAERVDFIKGQPFIHPEDMEEMTEYTDCKECHTGGIDTYD
jgi:hypothetical protein